MAQVRIPSDRPPTPPGQMLLEEFIRPLGMTQAELADRIGVSYVRLNEIVNGRRGITPSTALRLAKALGTTPQFWLNSQLALDLYRVSHDEEELRQLERIEPVLRGEDVSSCHRQGLGVRVLDGVSRAHHIAEFVGIRGEGGGLADEASLDPHSVDAVRPLGLAHQDRDAGKLALR